MVNVHCNKVLRSYPLGMFLLNTISLKIGTSLDQIEYLVSSYIVLATVQKLLKGKIDLSKSRAVDRSN